MCKEIQLLFHVFKRRNIEFFIMVKIRVTFCVTFKMLPSRKYICKTTITLKIELHFIEREIKRKKFPACVTNSRVSMNFFFLTFCGCYFVSENSGATVKETRLKDHKSTETLVITYRKRKQKKRIYFILYRYIP